MNTLPLEEAKKLATPGRLVVETLPACEGHEKALVLTGEDGAGDVVAWLEDNHEANAALLAHSMNIRDELIEALEKACTLARASDDEYEAIDGIEQTKALEAVLAKARTVEMP